jgi:ribosomal protein S12 methylthiotransferase accessory factor
MSEIYPVEELQWENNTVGNLVRPGMLRLPTLSQEECRELLDTLLDLDLADELPVTTLIGLCADPNTTWVDLRVGEIKALLGLAIGDEDAILDGCAWIGQFGQLDAKRAQVYRCIEAMMQLEDISAYGANLELLYGADAVKQAKALIMREQQFFGLGHLGSDMEGSQMHQQLLAAYAKVWPTR